MLPIVRCGRFAIDECGHHSGHEKFDVDVSASHHRMAGQTLTTSSFGGIKSGEVEEARKSAPAHRWRSARFLLFRLFLGGTTEKGHKS